MDYYISKKIITNKNELLQKIKRNTDYLEFASDELKSDRNVIFYAVSKNGVCLRYASEDFKSDEMIVKKAIYSRGLSLQYTSDQLKDREDIVLLACIRHNQALQYGSDRLKNDKSFVTKVIYQSKYDFPWIPENLIHDRSFMLTLVQNNARIFHILPNKWKDDEEIAFLACNLQRTCMIFKSVSERLKNDLSFVLTVSEYCPILSLNLPKKFKKNEEIITNVLHNDPSELEYVSKSFRKNPSIVLNCIHRDPYSVRYSLVPPEESKKIYLEVAKKNMTAFPNIETVLTIFPKLLSVILKISGYYLVHAPDFLKNKRKSICKAMKSFPVILGDKGYDRFYTIESKLRKYKKFNIIL